MNPTTIAFRGQRVDNGEWITGNLFVPNRLVKGIYICPDCTTADFFPDFEDGDDFEEAKKRMSGITLGRFHEVIPESIQILMPELPSEEEIDAKYEERNSSGTYLEVNMGRREGAKWMRSLFNQSSNVQEKEQEINILYL